MSTLKDRVYEGRDGATLGQNDQSAKQQHHDENRQQPELFSDPEKFPKFTKKPHPASQN
jgi:hypothetical protein